MTQESAMRTLINTLISLTLFALPVLAQSSNAVSDGVKPTKVANQWIYYLNPAFGKNGTTPTITVNGVGFTSNTIAEWDGVEVPTTFISSTQLTFTLSVAQASASGSHVIQVLFRSSNPVTEYYVALTGNDSNSGTKNSPS